MLLNLKRFSDNGESTLGLLYIDGKFFCYTIEDTHNEIKIDGQTRIPEGIYEIKYREVESEKTKQYREQFDWFNWHLELQDVPNFKYVYIHKGNSSKHTEGCIIVGNLPNNNQVTNDGFLGQSTSQFRRLYERVSRAINDRERVEIEIENIEHG